MFQFRAKKQAARSYAQSNRRPRSLASACAACEAVEARTYLSISFGTPSSVVVSGATSPIIAANFHGNASPIDLAVPIPGAIQILTGSGAGAFATGNMIPLPAGAATGAPFLAGNFIGAASDIVILSNDPASMNGLVTYETNSANATFTAGATSSITDNGNGFSPISAAVGDFNGDGHSDLAVIGKAPGISSLVLAILISEVNGSFAEVHDYSIPSSNSTSSNTDETVLAANLGNGRTDIVVNDSSGTSLDVFLGNGDGSFYTPNEIPFAASLISLGAFEGGSNLDIVGANGNQLMPLLGNGTGAFTLGNSITLNGPIAAMNTADEDGDGKVDIITNQGLLVSNGDGTFQAPVSLPVMLGGGGASFTGTLLSADINGDGKPDIVGFDASSNAIDTVLNTTTGGTTLAVASNSPSASAPTEVLFTATVSSTFSGAITGTVDFFDGATQIGSATVSGNSATFDAGPALSVGTHSITATYGGDANFSGSTSAPITQTILPGSTNTLTSNENPAAPGDTVTFTDTIVGFGGVPSGNVEFFDNATDLGGATLTGSDIAVFSTSALAVGQHSITAQYRGDSTFGPTTSAVLTETVTQPTLVPTIIASTVPAAVVGGTIVRGNTTITVKNVTPATITGPVTFNLFASTDGSVANAVMISTLHNKKLKVKAGQTLKFRLTVKTRPSTLPDGSYTLLAEAIDPSGNATNARTGPSVAVAAPFVKLKTSAVSAVKPPAITPGKKGSVSVLITNTGNVPTTGLATIDIGLSTDGQTQAVSLAMQINKLVIKAGKSKKLVLRFTIPAGQAAGMFFPYVSVTQDGSTATAVGTTMFAIT